MSEFLMVVPPGWVEFDLATAFSGVSPDDISRWIGEETWYDFDNHLEAQGLLPVGQTTVNARLFADGGLTRLWVLFGAV